MTLPKILDALDARGVYLEPRLPVVAPAGPLPPELLDALAEPKPHHLVELGRRLLWRDLSMQRRANQHANPTPDIDIILPNREQKREGLEAKHHDT